VNPLLEADILKVNVCTFNVHKYVFTTKTGLQILLTVNSWFCQVCCTCSAVGMAVPYSQSHHLQGEHS